MTSTSTLLTSLELMENTSFQCTDWHAIALYTDSAATYQSSQPSPYLNQHCSPDLFVAKSQSDSRMGLEGDPDLEQTEASVVSWIWQEISSSYLNIALTVAILYLLYKILLQKEEEQPISVEPPIPPMKKQVSEHNQLPWKQPWRR